MEILLEKDNKELENKLIDLLSTYIVDSSNLYLNLLIKEAQFYQKRLIRLEADKSFF